MLKADPSGRFFFVVAGALLAGAVIANEIRSFAQSAEVNRTRRSYLDMTEIDDDDRLESAAQAHRNLHAAADKGGDTAIKCTKTAIDAVTNPTTDAQGLAEQAAEVAGDALEAATGGGDDS